MSQRDAARRQRRRRQCVIVPVNNSFECYVGVEWNQVFSNDNGDEFSLIVGISMKRLKSLTTIS